MGFLLYDIQKKNFFSVFFKDLHVCDLVNGIIIILAGIVTFFAGILTCLHGLQLYIHREIIL